jgi:uncharacterized protein (DUF2461 family)
MHFFGRLSAAEEPAQRPEYHRLRNSIRREFRSFDSRVLGGLIEGVCGTARLGPESEVRMQIRQLVIEKARSVSSAELNLTRNHFSILPRTAA